jgi:hypothetical protein
LRAFDCHETDVPQGVCYACPAVDAAFKVAFRVGLLALALQVISAAQQRDQLNSPNASSNIAAHRAKTGELPAGLEPAARNNGFLPDAPMVHSTYRATHCSSPARWLYCPHRP